MKTLKNTSQGIKNIRKKSQKNIETTYILPFSFCRHMPYRSFEFREKSFISVRHNIMYLIFINHFTKYNYCHKKY